MNPCCNLLRNALNNSSKKNLEGTPNRFLGGFSGGLFEEFLKKSLKKRRNEY